MRIFNVFRLPKHSRYNYIPRFYDPDKEAMDERLKEIELQSEDSAEGMKTRIASGLRRGHGDTSIRRKSVLKSNMIVVGTVVVLVMLSVLFINYYLPRILESL